VGNIEAPAKSRAISLDTTVLVLEQLGARRSEVDYLFRAGMSGSGSTATL
jgi:hypothetical protein